jgi:hypothetical protein
MKLKELDTVALGTHRIPMSLVATKLIVPPWGRSHREHVIVPGEVPDDEAVGERDVGPLIMSVRIDRQPQKPSAEAVSPLQESPEPDAVWSRFNVVELVVKIKPQLTDRCVRTLGVMIVVRLRPRAGAMKRGDCVGRSRRQRVRVR